MVIEIDSDDRIICKARVIKVKGRHIKFVNLTVSIFTIALDYV